MGEKKMPHIVQITHQKREPAINVTRKVNDPLALAAIEVARTLLGESSVDSVAAERGFIGELAKQYEAQADDGDDAAADIANKLNELHVMIQSYWNR